MSINKQLYFGIFGILALFCFLCLILILLASLKFFFIYNTKIKSIFNEMDTNIASLNGENADIFGQLAFNQGKFEAFFLRRYFNTFNNKFGEDFLNIFRIDSEEINNHFKFHNDQSELCKEENSKCFFVFSDNNNINELNKKILYFLIPTIEISLKTNSYNKQFFLIFNKFHFFEKENNAFISYKYDENFINKNFQLGKSAYDIMNNNIISFLSSKDQIEELNEMKIEQMTNNDFFNNNAFSIFPSFLDDFMIDPFYKAISKTLHFGSYQFNKNKIDDNSNVDLSKIKIDNLDNYLSLDMKIDYISFFSLNFIERNGVIFIFILTKEGDYSVSRTVCKLFNFINYTYSEESINENLNFSVGLLDIDKFQIYDVKNCFKNKKILEYISSSKNYNYSLKILSDLYKYGYYKDSNNKIMAKYVRVFSPNKFTKALLKLKFYSSFSIYYFVIKIYNNILIINNIIDRITYRSISYIIICSFILWFFIFLFIFYKLYSVVDTISSPIRKLIKNISLSQENFNNNDIDLEKIYYREDKDINDLFQLCQKLIVGGFRKKNNFKKKNTLNVYNNISIVKTNNMIINEKDIIIQKNRKYNEIFEKKNELEISEDNFKDEIYHQYKNDNLNSIILNYESLKNKKLFQNEKEEKESIKTKDSEYKMFYYINKEIENYLPYNNLYKYYYEEFYKKGNKKKKK